MDNGLEQVPERPNTENMASPCRVLIVDDHPVLRVGLSVTLEHAGGFVVCGEAETPEAAREAAERLQPDAAVVDLSLGGRDGIDLIEDLTVIHPPMLLLVYSRMDEMLYAKRALRAGARGYLTKKGTSAEVAEALGKILRGERVVGERVLRQSGAGDGAGVLDALSDRELQVFRLLGGGLGSAEIAARLNLSVKTVSTYRERLKLKLSLSSGGSLERAAYEFALTHADVLPRR